MRLSTFLVFPALFWASNGQNINQLFHTVPIPGGGSCSGAQSLALNSWLTDTLTLVNAGVQDLNTFKMDNVDATPRLTRNLIAWFKVLITKDRKLNAGDTGNPILDHSVNPPVQANMRTFPIPKAPMTQ